MSSLPKTDPKLVIMLILDDIGEASTAELIEEVAQLSMECKDRVPRSLLALVKEGKIKKRISKKHRAIMWSLSSPVPSI